MPRLEPEHTQIDFFSEVYDRFYDRIYNYVYFRCHDAVLSDDLTARVFERALAGLDGFDPQKGLLDQWLFTIARNALADHWRRASRFRRVSLDGLRLAAAAENEPERRLLADEETRALVQAVRKLPERARDILGLKFIGRLNNRQIAGITGLGENHVAVIIYRAIGQLRTQLTKEEA